MLPMLRGVAGLAGRPTLAAFLGVVTDAQTPASVGAEPYDLGVFLGPGGMSWRLLSAADIAAGPGSNVFALAYRGATSLVERAHSGDGSGGSANDTIPAVVKGDRHAGLLFLGQSVGESAASTGGVGFNNRAVRYAGGRGVTIADFLKPKLYAGGGFSTTVVADDGTGFPRGTIYEFRS